MTYETFCFRPVSPTKWTSKGGVVRSSGGQEFLGENQNQISSFSIFKFVNFFMYMYKLSFYEEGNFRLK